MEDRLIEPFLDAARRVFDTMLHMEASFEPAVHGAEPSPPRGVVGAVRLRGGMEGVLMLSVPEEAARRMAGMLTASDHRIEEEDAADAIGEIAEMIAGSAARAIGQSGVSASRSRHGDGPRSGAGDAMHAASVIGQCECGEFTLSLALSRGAAAGGES